MANPFTINGLDGLKKKLQNLTDNLKPDIDEELLASADVIEGLALLRAPKDNGFLVQGISKRKSGELKHEILSAADYSAFVEFGTRTLVNIPAGLEEFAAQFKGSSNGSARTAKEAIYEWCRSNGIDPGAWYAIYVKLMVTGMKPHPFFFAGFLEEKPKLIARIKAIVSDPK